MALGLRRNHHVSHDTFDALARYGDRAHNLYNDGLARTADLYHHGRDRAEDAYDHGRRRAVDAYGESRHRLEEAADALAGRRTASRGPIVGAAALGVAAGAALLLGALWLLRRPRPAEPIVPTTDQVDDLIAGDGGVTATTAGGTIPPR
jgi:hypothetical protein